MVANFASVYGAFATVAPDRWAEAERAVTDVMAVSAQQKEKDTEQKTRLALLTEIGEQVSSNGDRRLIWLELMKTIFSSLGRDPELAGKSAQELPYKDRMDFHITKVDSVYIKDLSKWSATFLAKYTEETRNRIKLVGTAVPVAPVVPGQPALPAPLPPTGPKDSGWLVQIDGYHFFNGEDKRGTGGADHIRKFLIERLENGTVMVPGPDGKPTEYSLKEMGISYPLLVKAPELKLQNRIINPVYERLTGGVAATSQYGGEGDSGGGGASMAPTRIVLKDEAGNEVPFDFEAPLCYFTIQFVWQEKTLADRTWWREQKIYDKFAIPPRRVGGVQSAASPQIAVPYAD
jgi:type IV pilus assembly protein PilM